MCSLALWDAGMVAIGWLMNAVAVLSQNWPFGGFMCKFLTYVQGVTGDCSTWTIVIVSIDRFHACAFSRINNRLSLVIVSGYFFLETWHLVKLVN